MILASMILSLLKLINPGLFKKTNYVLDLCNFINGKYSKTALGYYIRIQSRNGSKLVSTLSCDINEFYFFVSTILKGKYYRH
jgi:hypothetical protein